MCSIDHDKKAAAAENPIELIENDSSSPGRQRLKFGVEAILAMNDSSPNIAREKYDRIFDPDYSSGTFPLTCVHCYGPSESYLHLEPIYTAPCFSEFYHATTMYLPTEAGEILNKEFKNFVVETGKCAKKSLNKRKRTWSRAVFSNLQRKGLEKRFQIQKYIMKPDRRQLAATLGLTDAQVKVWFQNRRMKWRNSKQTDKDGGELK